MTSTGILPADLGLPSKYQSWRHRQEEALMEQADSSCRFLTQCAGTGTGKTGTYLGCSSMLGVRTCILTHTKALQAQVLEDGAGMGLVDIRGKNNYTCANSPKLTCEQAWPICSAHSAKPSEQGTRCTYQLALIRARSSSLVSTNYSMWMASNSFGEGLGEFDRLVLDEAHASVELIAQFLSIELTIRELAEDLKSIKYPSADSSVLAWAEFASSLLVKASGYVLDITAAIKEGEDSEENLVHLSKYQELVRKLTAMAAMDDEWIVDSTKHGFRFDPIWPAKYAESILFRNIPSVLLVSATIRPKTLDLLGIDNTDSRNSKFSEYPSSFPAKLSPVYHIIDSPNMSYAANQKDPNNLRFWISYVDAFIRRRLDRKGIIHTISFDLLKYLLANSEHSRYMISNDTTYAGGDRRTTQVIEEFKSSQAPTILASPSLSTGFDFPGELCEYQVIAKLPYAPAVSKVAKARKERDKEYYDYLTAQDIVQMCGRGTRSEKDQCENLILDDRIKWFMKNRHLFPSDFARRFRSVPSAPEPLKKL